jgi:hypothetical protein
MVRIKNEFKIAFIFGLIIVSLGIGVLQSNFLKPTKKKSLSFEEMKTMKTAYVEAGNEKRTKMYIATSDFTAVMDAINQAMTQNNATILNAERATSQYQMIAEISNENFDNLLFTLRKQGRLVKEKTESFPIASIDQDIINSEIENRTKENETLSSKLQNLKISDRERITSNTILQENYAKIDSLKKLPEFVKKNKENQLIQLIVKSEVKAENADLMKMKKMMKITFMTFVALIILSIAFYLLTLVLLKLMNLLGIKTVHQSSRYGYSYGKNREKKIKRIYKDHHDKEKQ